MAVVAVILDTQGKYNDQLVSLEFQYMRVWEEIDQIWKVVAVRGVQL